MIKSMIKSKSDCKLLSLLTVFRVVYLREYCFFPLKEIKRGKYLLLGKKNVNYNFLKIFCAQLCIKFLFDFSTFSFWLKGIIISLPYRYPVL